MPKFEEKSIPAVFQNRARELRLMKDYARVEQIRKFTLLDNEWSQDTDELTPTLKLKRRVISQKYKDITERMYPPED